MYPELPHGLGLAKLSLPYFKRLVPGSPDRFEDLAMAMGYDTSEFDENQRASVFLEGLKKAIPPRNNDAADSVRNSIPSIFAVRSMPLAFQKRLLLLIRWL